MHLKQKNGSNRHKTVYDRERTDRQTLFADVDELAGVHALNSEEGGSALLEAQGVTERHLSQRGTTTGIVHNYKPHE